MWCSFEETKIELVKYIRMENKKIVPLKQTAFGIVLIINMQIGSHIKSAREAAGLTQEFAERVSLGPKIFRISSAEWS